MCSCFFLHKDSKLITGRPNSNTAGTFAQLAEFGLPLPGRKPRPDQPDKTESLKTCVVNLCSVISWLGNSCNSCFREKCVNDGI